MNGWYSIILFGWLITTTYAIVTALFIRGIITFETGSFGFFLLNNLHISYSLLLLILLFARFKKVKIFAKPIIPNEQKGFTLIELLISISIIAILAKLIFPVFQTVREDAYLVRAQQEFNSIHQALILYKERYGDFPADTNRDIPPGLEEFLGPGIWPDSSWPGSVYDWDYWTDPDDPNKRILQISARFCPIGAPSQCRFPEKEWASDFDINSAVYYCIEGACRSHLSKPINHPGYCVNCPE